MTANYCKWTQMLRAREMEDGAKKEKMKRDEKWDEGEGRRGRRKGKREEGVDGGVVKQKEKEIKCKWIERG